MAIVAFAWWPTKTHPIFTDRSGGLAFIFGELSPQFFPRSLFGEKFGEKITTKWTMKYSLSPQYGACFVSEFSGEFWALFSKITFRPKTHPQNTDRTGGEMIKKIEKKDGDFSPNFSPFHFSAQNEKKK